MTAIKQWFTSQPEDVQRELALLVGAYLFDVPTMVLFDKDKSIPMLLDWLDDTGRRHRQLGKMLSFRACLDNVLRKRDSAEDWAESEDFTRRVAAEAGPEMEESMAKMIADYPARAEQWVAVSQSWYDLSARIFDYDQLDYWALTK